MGDPTATTDRGTENPATADRGIAQALKLKPKGVMPPLEGPVMHTLLFFSGWKVQNALTLRAEQLPMGVGIMSTLDLMSAVRRLPQPPHRRMIGFYGVLGENPNHWLMADQPSSPVYNSTIASAARFILENYDPRGKLIIYGFSAGAVTALDLAWGMSQYASVWIPGLGLHPNNPRGNHIKYPARIDLLITIDAAAGPLSGRLNRRVPSIVTVNHNFFQTRALQHQENSKGGPNQAGIGGGAKVINEDWTGRRVRRPDGGEDVVDHHNIGYMTNAAALRAIRGCLFSRASIPGQVDAPTQ